MEHALHFVDVIVEPFVLFAAKILEIARKKDVILELTCRSNAMCRNRAKSASLPRPHPSAMFVEIEAAARRAWLVNPYRSSRGNPDVA